MPIYEYNCAACGHEMDALQKVSEPPLTDCPECHEAKLVKRISAPTFRLKGGGWYETDFKSGNKRNLAGEQSEAKKGDQPETKKDKKPAAGGDSKKSADSGSTSPSDSS